MSSNVGHTIQKMINSTPVSASVNSSTTTIVTNGGSVYQAGLMHNKIQSNFQEVLANPNIIGHVIASASTDDNDYFLSANGYVFEYIYNAGSCSPTVREVYSPAACCGDKAVRIQAGSHHLVILTHHHKVFGVGDNSEYQLVPQGQCEYNSATQLLVTNTNVHDNESCCKFLGTINELKKPIIPKKSSCKISCLQDKACKIIGCLSVTKVNITGDGTTTVTVPVWADYSYVGFICADECDEVSGSLTLSIDRIFIKCGCQKQSHECENVTNASVTQDLTIGGPIVLTVPVTGHCGGEFEVKLSPPTYALPVASVLNGALVLTLNAATTAVVPLCNGTYASLAQGSTLSVNVDIDVDLNCCEPCKPQLCEESCLPQPCWVNVFAGSNTTVLVDDCNRIYVLGSLHRVRNNANLLKRSCLEELLRNTDASIHLPADELNCCLEANNGNCACPQKSCHKPFRTDLSKFGVNLKFNNCDDDCDSTNNVCDFLKALKNCNDAPACNNTCAPCDSSIYVDIGDSCDHDCDSPVIKSITLYNKKSVCKEISQRELCCEREDTKCRNRPVCVRVNAHSVVEFDSNKYCIDGTDYCLDRVVKLEFADDGEEVTLYLDIDAAGSVQFTQNCDKSNVEFPLFCHEDNKEKYILNYGAVLDPVALANLKYLLVCDATFPCPQYRNPIRARVTSAYLNGGDRICFVKEHGHKVKFPVTPDLPTVFRLNRRVLDVGVGHNNLSVLVGGLACPNEIYAIGENCHGELGINSNVSTVCFKQVNRCLFDCQVNSIFADNHVTTYVTQSGRVYGAGQWKCLINSTIPRHISSVCQSWKIRQVAVSETHIVLVSNDGCVYGLGDNSLGELGLCHIDCVPIPTPLSFFHKLSNYIASESNVFLHPVKRQYQNKYHHNECAPCNPCDEPIRKPEEVRYVRHNKIACADKCVKKINPPRYNANERHCGKKCSK